MNHNDDHFPEVDLERLGRMLRMVVDVQGESKPSERGARQQEWKTNYQQCDVKSKDGIELCRIFADDNEIVVTFQGTVKGDSQRGSRQKRIFRNMNYGRLFPFNVGQPKMTPSPLGGQSKVHPGFAKALFGDTQDYAHLEEDCFMQRVLEACDELQAQQPRPMSFAGHSAGAALACIAASYFAAHKPDIEVHDIYMSGSSRFGGKHFRDRMNQAVKGNMIRFEMLDDPIAALPRYEEEHYVHMGRYFGLKPDGTRIPSTQATEHPYDSYSNPLTAVLMSLHQLGRPYRELHRIRNYLKAFAKHVKDPENNRQPIESFLAERSIKPKDIDIEALRTQTQVLIPKLQAAAESYGDAEQQGELSTLTQELEKAVESNGSTISSARQIIDALAAIHTEAQQTIQLPEELVAQLREVLISFSPHFPPPPAKQSDRALV